MQQKITDGAAVIAGVSSPAWVPMLEQVNTVLAFISGGLSLSFIVWRWWRAVRAKGSSRRGSDHR